MFVKPKCSKEDSQVLILSTMKTLLLKKNDFCVEMSFLIHNKTRDYNALIEFYDHQVDSIIGPTIKTFPASRR